MNVEIPRELPWTRVISWVAGRLRHQTLPSAMDRAAQRQVAANLIETSLLLFLFAWLILKGFFAHRDALYGYVGGFVLFAFVSLRYRERMFLVNKTVLFYITLSLFASLSALWAHDEYLVFLDAREMAAAIPAMIAIYQICRTTGGVRRVLFSLKVVLITAVGLTLIAGAYSYGNREFLQMNSSVVTPFMLLSFTAAFLERQTRRKCFFCVVTMAVAIVPVLIVSSVRSVAVILAIVATYGLLISIGSAIGRILGAVVVAGLVAVVVLYGSVMMSALEGTRYYRHYSHAVEYVEEGTLEGSIGFRLMVQDLALDMIKERPVAGHGLNNSRYLFERWIGMPTYTHSGFMELLVGLGFVGLTLFLLIFYESLISYLGSWSDNKRGSAAGLSILAGFIVFNFIGPFYASVELLLALTLLSSGGMIELIQSQPRVPVRRRVLS